MTEPLHHVEVCAPSRLHFGLFAFDDLSAGARFGGVGAMVDAPGLRLSVGPAPEFSVAGPHAARIAAFAERVRQSFGWGQAPACRVRVHAAPRQHVGLGVGTQLGMAVVTALTRWRGIDDVPIERRARAVGRGRRSAVGTHGFECGGLIVDSGHAAPGAIGRVEARIPIPRHWRFVLIIDRSMTGLAGRAEHDAFGRLPPVPMPTTLRLRRLALDELTPAAGEDDFDRFACAIHEYGVLAGGCFAAVQGGPFASDVIRRRVDLVRALGHEGCGQTSWGPTVFALARNEESARALVEALRDEPITQPCELVISSPNNVGASVVVRRSDAALEQSVLRE